MFNEVFWFMYVVDMGERLAGLGIIGFLLTLVFVTARGIYISDNMYNDDSIVATKNNLNVLKKFSAGWAAIIVVSIFWPTPATFYAGAGYYVAEQTEVTDTVMALKSLLDQKIEELGDDTPE